MASVKVAVRVRPFNKRELDLESKLIVKVSGNQVQLEENTHNSSNVLKTKVHKFTFDYSYWSHDKSDSHFVDQDQVYNDLGTDVVENAFEGYNACVFAYGQTGSGKTFTMMGSEENRGLIPRICQTMFQKMQSGKEEGTTYRTEVSYLEIYNEKVKDLLRKGSQHNLKVREHPQSGPYVENLSRHLVMDFSEILALMEKGNDVRTTASTNMNDTSSRSHAIFTITFVNAGFLQGVPHETVSKIHLVDLAGSERADATGATGQRLKEGAHINKSLVTLGSVISALADASNASSVKDSKKNFFIPYRDSVLTWLLKDSLGGNSKTMMIATISPAEINHGETLSTLRYANRAKNIINKPTVNEDPNVRLIRELRDEIDRLRSMMSLDPDTLSSVQKQLAVKEAQERHLTEEWTEKWKEAANILKEQRALALKRTGLGVILDSDKPHLVGIDEDVLSTGITLYHLKDGDTVIGNDSRTSDIVLKGPCLEDIHCRIHLKDGVANLRPMPGALCMVNASLVTEETRLSQGCIVVLGKTNMFRYNDPKEAENLRQNKDQVKTLSPQNRSLLSHSLSDLRHNVIDKTKQILNPKLHSSESAIIMEASSSSSNLSLSQDLENSSVMSISQDQESWAGDQSIATKGTQQPNEEMSDLYNTITEQKNIIMTCLESDQCDITTLNNQIAVLKTMQEQYSKLEHEIARSLWINSHAVTSTPSADAGDKNLHSFEEQFSELVEQEVDRRLFQEKVLKAESEFHERERLRLQKERELNEIRRQHEKEIYMLKRKLAEANLQQERNSSDQAKEIFQFKVDIPSFRVSLNGQQHVEFEVVVTAKDNSWTVMRRYRRFRDLHISLCHSYGPLVQAISFPPRRLFGSTSDSVCVERQRCLQIYLNTLLQRCSAIPTSPLFKRPYQAALIEFSSFFQPTDDP